MTKKKQELDTRLMPNRFTPRTGVPDALGGGLPFNRFDEGLPTGFHRLSGMQKLNAMLDLPKAEEFVRNLPSQELHQIIHHIGLEDAAVLVPHTSPEQFKSLLYFDLWVGYDFLPERLERWLWALDEFGEHEDTSARVGHLDPEVLISLFARWTEILKKETQDEELDLPDSPYLFASPDQRYHIHVLGDKAADRFPLIYRLVRALYDFDLKHAHRILDDSSGSLVTENEECALHFRNAWLEDFGFLPFEVAVKMYGFLAPGLFKGELQSALDGENLRIRGYEDPVLCTSLMSLRKTEGFLAEVLRGINDEEALRSFTVAFTYLSNRASVVHGLDLTDLHSLGDESRRSFHAISVALEYLTDGDRELGSTILNRIDLVTIHRVGVSLLEELGRKAREVLDLLGGAGAAHLFDSPLDDIVGAVAHRFPLFVDLEHKSGVPVRRPFENLQEVEQIRIRIAQASAVGRFFADSYGLKASQSEDVEEVASSPSDTRISSIWLTLLLRSDWETPPTLSPVDLEQARCWLDSLDRHDVTTDLEGTLRQRSSLLLDKLLFPEDTRSLFLDTVLAPAVERIASLPEQLGSDDTTLRLLGDLFVLDTA